MDESKETKVLKEQNQQLRMENIQLRLRVNELSIMVNQHEHAQHSAMLRALNDEMSKDVKVTEIGKKQGKAV